MKKYIKELLHRLFVNRYLSQCGSLFPQWNKEAFLPDGAIPAKFLLGKSGSDQNHIAIVAIQADEPVCVICDSTVRNGVTILDFPVGCSPLTGTPRQLWCLAGGTINDGDDLVSKGNGQVLSLQDAGTAAGTYWKVGNAYGDSATGSATVTDEACDGVTFRPCTPVEVTKA